MATSIASI